MHRGIRPGLAVVTSMVVAGLGVVNAGQATAAHQHVRDGQILYAVHDQTIDDLVPYVVDPDGNSPHQVFDQPMECAHWSPGGTQIASCGAPDPDTTTILDVDSGATRFLPNVAPNLITPCYVWSSDSRRMACEGFSPDDEDTSQNGIFTVRVRDWRDARRLTRGGDVPGDYSPNSKQLVFSRFFFDDEDANVALFRINVNGTGLDRITPPDLAVASPGAWSPSGNQILFSGRADSDHRQMLFVVHADGRGLHPLVVEGIACGGRFDDPTSIGCSNPTWSPSGRQIAFRVNSSSDSILERSCADGSHPAFVVDMGFDPGETVDWGTHPTAGGR